MVDSHADNSLSSFSNDLLSLEDATPKPKAVNNKYSAYRPRMNFESASKAGKCSVPAAPEWSFWGLRGTQVPLI